MLAAAFVTGALAFGIGSGWVVWAVAAHAVTGLCIVVLSPSKSVVARRGLRRARAGRSASVLFSVCIVVVIVTGVTHALGFARSLGPVTAMQVHVGAALLVVPLALWHVVARPARVHRADASRRQLVRGGTLLAGGGLLYVALEGVAVAASLVGARRRATGSHERGSFEPAAMPVTQWLDDKVLDVDASEWTLGVRAGREERVWSYAELAAFADEVEATLDCTGGWYARQTWRGAWLTRLLPPASGRSILVVSRSGYSRRLPLSDAPDLLVATHIGDLALSAGHGYPARLVAPRRRGFWWVKWIDRIEVGDTPWWLQPPFPLT